jgi:hypothetical protein
MKTGFAISLGLMLLAENSYAYDLQTHANMTHYAYLRSNLGVNDLLLKDLGVDIYGVYGNDFKDLYYDMGSSSHDE